MLKANSLYFYTLLTAGFYRQFFGGFFAVANLVQLGFSLYSQVLVRSQCLAWVCFLCCGTDTYTTPTPPHFKGLLPLLGRISQCSKNFSSKHKRSWITDVCPNTRLKSTCIYLTRQYQNEIQSYISATYQKHFQPLFWPYCEDWKLVPDPAVILIYNAQFQSFQYTPSVHTLVW